MKLKAFTLTLVLVAVLLLPMPVSYAYSGTSNVTDASVNDERVDPNASVNWTVGPILNGTENPIQNGWGMDFDGIDDYINIDDSASLDGIKAHEAWIYITADLPDTGPNVHIISTKSNLYMGGIGINQVTGVDSFEAAFYNGTHVSECKFTVPIYGEWYHLVAQINAAGDRAELYVNGEFKSQGDVVPGLTTNNGHPVRIAGGILDRYYNDTIDEVRAYNRTLSPGEIAYSYEHKVPLNQTGLVLWVDFDSNVQDQTANGNDGTINGDPVYVRGIRGKAAMTFDGTGDYVQYATLNVDADNLTLMFFVTPNFINANFQDGAVHDNDWGIQIKEDAIRGPSRFVIGGWLPINYVTPITVGTRYFLAFSYDGTTQRLYFNGNEGNSAVVAGDELFLAGNFYVGTSAFVNLANSTIDELRVYNYTLSAPEIAQCYQGIFPTHDLVVHTDFDGQVQDQSGNGNNGAVNGDPEYSDGWASCPVSTSYNGTGGTTVQLVNSTTGLCTIPDTAPATYGNYTVTATVPAATANATYTGFIVDSYLVNVYSLYETTEEGFQTLLYADGASRIDGHQLTSGDTLTIEGVSFTWNAYTSRFEATDSETTPQTKTYDTLTALSEANYSITSGSMNITATVTWTQGTMDRLQSHFMTGDWVGAVLGEYTYAMGTLFFYTVLMTILSVGIYNVGGAYTTILTWILGWGVFSSVVHGQAQLIGYIFILLGVAIALVKLALDRRTT